MEPRAAMGVRDGGCRWVGCDRSPAWSEARHINGWRTDNGSNDLAEPTLVALPSKSAGLQGGGLACGLDGLDHRVSASSTSVKCE